MYRIIGFFEDSNGVQHMKLIKKEALNTKYEWSKNSGSDIDWKKSELYNGINGSYFLTNTTNYPYMAETTWTNKIAIWNYTVTNTKSYENYNSTNGTPYGPSYYSTPIRAIYLHELNRSKKDNEICYYSSKLADCTVGEWTSVSSKIGLMYASDFLLSLGESALEYKSYDNREILKTGWMHLSNNDLASLSTTSAAPPNPHEWTISHYGVDHNGNYRPWYVVSDGYLNSWYSSSQYAVRPVFYLESNVKIIGGDGSSSNPYIIG